MTITECYIDFTAVKTDTSTFSPSIFDPLMLSERLAELGYDTNHWDGKPNCFISPRGKYAGKGWLLLVKSDLDQIDIDATTHKIKFTDSTGETSVEFDNLIVSDSRALAGNDEEQSNDIYLVELSDNRLLGMLTGIDKGYNVRTPANLPGSVTYSAAGTDLYYKETRNGASDWTWETMIQDIWLLMPGPLGALDTTGVSYPTDNPENYKFHGISAWDALFKILDDINHILVPVSVTVGQVTTFNGTYKLILAGAVQADQAANLAAALPDIQDISYHRTTTITDTPEKITVCFPKRDYAFQTGGDDDEPTAQDYWLNRPLYKVEVTTASIDATITTMGGTNTFLHDGMFALYNDVGTLQNSTPLSTRATEIATRYINALQIADASLDNVYSGIHKFSLGEEVSCLAYFDLGLGFYTEVILSPREFLPRGNQGQGGVIPLNHVGRASERVASEFPGSPDIARPHSPPFRWVVCTLAGALAANGSATANVQFGTGSITWSNTALPHQITVHEVGGVSVPSGTRGIAFFHPQVGRWIVFGIGSEITVNIVRFELTANLSLGGSAAAKVLACSGDVPVDTAITVSDTYIPGTRNGLIHHGNFGPCKIGDRGTAYWHPSDTGCDYTILYMEHQAVFISVTLTSGFSGSPSQASAQADSDYWQGREPSGALIVEDRLGHYSEHTTGDKLICCYDEIDDVYVIIDGLQVIAEPLCVTIAGYTKLADGVQIKPFHVLQVDLETGLSLWRENANPARGLIRMNTPGKDGVVYNAPTSGDYPRWTDCVLVNNSVTIGENPDVTWNGGGWLTIYGKDAVGKHQISSADFSTAETHNWKLPLAPAGSLDTDWGASSHLAIQGVTDTAGNYCIEWKYTKPGLTGSFDYKDSAGGNQTVTLSDGLVTGITDTENINSYSNPGASCYFNTCTTVDFCP